MIILHQCLGAKAPQAPSQGRCSCTSSGPARPLDPTLNWSILPNHFFQFPCLIIIIIIFLTIIIIHQFSRVPYPLKICTKCLGLPICVFSALGLACLTCFHVLSSVKVHVTCSFIKLFINSHSCFEMNVLIRHGNNRQSA